MFSEIATKLIHKSVPTPLSTVAFHHDVPCINRLFASGFPMHLAVHRVSSVETPPPAYTEPHTHDVAEINIILGDEGGLEYEIQLGDEVFTVASNANIYIPAGMVHSANVLRGEGYFIAI